MSNERLTQRRWIVLIASCIVNLSIGALYSWSVFAGPMAEHLNAMNGTALTAADLAIVFSIGNGDGFLSMIAGGFLNEKLGTKWVVLLGVLMFGTGFIVCGLAHSVAMLILGYGILSGLSMGFAYGLTISNSVKFFPDRKGLVGGLTTASYGIGSVLIPPIANALNESVGVSKAFILLGLFTIVVGGIAAMFIVPCPADFRPTGWDPAGGKVSALSDRQYTWKEMLASPLFYVMIIMLFFGASFGMMTISQASNISQNMMGMTASAAALVVSVLALFNTFGRIFCGYLSDRIGRVQTITGVYVLASVTMLLLLLSARIQSTALFVVCISLVGVSFGAFMGIYPGFTNEVFGQRHASINYGIMFIGFSAAGIVAPLIMKSFYNSVGSYGPAFLTAFVMAVIGLLLTAVFHVVRARSD
ncbi:MAG: OFA family MFS transporter [Clostridia bacterium]|nr:OFA family MFS transporter [Clostridia bacterium]